MNLSSSHPSPLKRFRQQSRAAFTMIEIALCLAIIGFALVAIIGVLPAGLNVQKDNREETVINFDAAYMLDALRNGVRGDDTLTNFVIAITNYHVAYLPNSSTHTLTKEWYYNLPDGSGKYLYSPPSGGVISTPNPFLTNGALIIGLMSYPKYTPLGQGFLSNYTTADFRAFSGSLIDEGTNSSSHDFAFHYRITCELTPYGFPAWTNYNSAIAASVDANEYNLLNSARLMEANLTQIRLRYNWPVLPNGQTAGGRQIYRTLASGAITNFTASARSVPQLFFVQPQTFAP